MRATRARIFKVLPLNENVLSAKTTTATDFLSAVFLPKSNVERKNYPSWSFSQWGVQFGGRHNKKTFCQVQIRTDQFR